MHIYTRRDVSNALLTVYLSSISSVELFGIAIRLLNCTGL